MFTAVLIEKLVAQGRMRLACKNGFPVIFVKSELHFTADEFVDIAQIRVTAVDKIFK